MGSPHLFEDPTAGGIRRLTGAPQTEPADLPCESSKRHVRFHRGSIHFSHEGCLTEVALPFAVLILQDVSLALFTAKQLTRGSKFEPFGDGFPRFRDTSVLGHRGAEFSGRIPSSKGFFAPFSGDFQAGCRALNHRIFKNGNQKIKSAKK